MHQNEIHIVLQGKGGVGKSLVAALVAQYLKSIGATLYCADTDPVNNTFSQYAAIEAEHLKIMGSNNTIDSRMFDSLIEKLVTFDGAAVVDNGAASFLPLTAYMLENDVISVLQNAGKKVVLHSILTGGQAMEETMYGLQVLLESQSTAPVVVWENEYFGDIVKDGRTFTESKLYKTHKERICGLVRLHKRNPDTFGKDVELMINGKLTFEEAANSEQFTLMPKQRLLIVKDSIFDQLKEVRWA